MAIEQNSHPPFGCESAASGCSDMSTFTGVRLEQGVSLGHACHNRTAPESRYCLGLLAASCCLASNSELRPSILTVALTYCNHPCLTGHQGHRYGGNLRPFTGLMVAEEKEVMVLGSQTLSHTLLAPARLMPVHACVTPSTALPRLLAFTHSQEGRGVLWTVFFVPYFLQ